MIYVLLPIYNEKDNLKSLIGRIKASMERHGYDYRIVAYDDGSKDGSGDFLRELAADSPLTVTGKAQNEGLGYAFYSLLREVDTLAASDDDIAVLLDADNSHNPELIFKMIDRILSGYDVVIASRYRQDSRIVGVTLFRQILSLGASWVMRLLFPIKGVRDYTCGYRAYSLSCIRRALAGFPDGKLIEERGFACMAEMLIKLRSLGVLVAEVPLVLRYDKKLGESKMDIGKTVKRTLAMIARLASIK